MSRYILLPVSDGDPVSITLPGGLITNDLYDELKHKVINKTKLKWLLEQLAYNQISEADQGGIEYQDKNVSDVILREALIDTCNNEFFEKYEDFYKLLRKCNITF